MYTSEEYYSLSSLLLVESFTSYSWKIFSLVSTFLTIPSKVCNFLQFILYFLIPFFHIFFLLAFSFFLCNLVLYFILHGSNYYISYIMIVFLVYAFQVLLQGLILQLRLVGKFMGLINHYTCWVSPFR